MNKNEEGKGWRVAKNTIKLYYARRGAVVKSTAVLCGNCEF